MKKAQKNGLLVVLAVILIPGIAFAGHSSDRRPSNRHSSDRRPSNRSSCGNPGFSISISSGNVRTSYRSPQYRSSDYWHNRRHCRPIVRSYPKRFPIGPVIVYSTSRLPQPVQEKVIIVITNDNGSQTPVELTKLDGQGYRGPKGEFYSQLPTEGQLKALYGLSTVVTTISDLQTASTVVTVWLENENGSKTPVQLIRQGRSYIGPEGEYYPSMPTKDQLRAIYGLYRDAAADNTTTVIIHNSDGTTTPVVLVNDGQNYIGPNGEYYSYVPTAKQLVPIYGR